MKVLSVLCMLLILTACSAVPHSDQQIEAQTKAVQEHLNEKYPFTYFEVTTESVNRDNYCGYDLVTTVKDGTGKSVEIQITRDNYGIGDIIDITDNYNSDK